MPWSHVVLDTNCLIYFLDDASSSRGRWLADHVLRPAVQGSLLLSVATLSLAELLVRPFADGQPERAAAVRRAVSNLPGLTLVPLDTDVAAAAARVRAERRMRLPDAIVLATALVTDGTLLTNDRRLAGDQVDILDDVMTPPR